VSERERGDVAASAEVAGPDARVGEVEGLEPVAREAGDESFDGLDARVLDEDVSEVLELGEDSDVEVDDSLEVDGLEVGQSGEIGEFVGVVAPPPDEGPEFGERADDGPDGRPLDARAVELRVRKGTLGLGVGL
jgi:hypothetical protein